MFVLLDEFFGLLIIIAIITQVMIPTVFDRPLWPLFRRRKVVDDELADARAFYEEAEKKAALVELKQKTDKIVKQSEPVVETAVVEQTTNNNKENNGNS